MRLNLRSSRSGTGHYALLNGLRNGMDREKMVFFLALFEYKPKWVLYELCMQFSIKFAFILVSVVVHTLKILRTSVRLPSNVQE